MLRSAIAIIVGFITIGVLSVGTSQLVIRLYPGAFAANGGTRDVGMLVLALFYVTVYAVGGCWLTARLAPNRPMRHAMILGVLGLAFNIAGTAAQWNSFPAWYNIVALILVLPSAWLGGRLAERTHGATVPVVATAA